MAVSYDEAATSPPGASTCLPWHTHGTRHALHTAALTLARRYDAATTA